MKKQIALAYGIAGVAVAVAIVTVARSETSVFNPVPEQVSSKEAAKLDSPGSHQGTVDAEPNVETVPPIEEAAAEPQVEVVYVDEPSRPERRGYVEHDDDDDDQWEHERREREHEEDDDD